MFKIEDILESIRSSRFRITDHADEETHNDLLSFDEVITSVMQGEIVEEYPRDKPFPSCLISGLTMHGEPVHSVWAFNNSNKWAVLITVYRPDPARWIKWKIRRKS
jgi:hypothetical protein